MLIGLDFDNTIVCYDHAFHRLALERGLIPAELPPSKSRVRDYLRARGREQAWIELQGLAYGQRMGEAELFPGADECIRGWLAGGLEVAVVSHKTRRPYAGDGPDLQAAAYAWLEARGGLLGSAAVFFELTKHDKLRRIAELGCDWFVDDLPEFLGEPGFPTATRRVLFDPTGAHTGEDRFPRGTSWAELARLIQPAEVAAR
jgi:hypothetical protein